jgi:vacuolar-type H+-ATPase subunit H
MNDADMLKKILEAENSGRELVREAQEKADGNVHEVLISLQDDFRSSREARLRQISEEAEAYTLELENTQKERLAEFEQSLQKEKISFQDAGNELNKILSLDAVR